MGFSNVNAGAAATTFFALYTIYLAVSIYALTVRGWKSRYTFLFFFALLRFGAQLCGMVFAIKGYTAVNWLVAYLVLGAEGYFTLILGSFLSLVYAEVAIRGSSRARPTKAELEELSGGDKWKITRIRLTCPASLFHWTLIPANAFIIAGGSMLTGVSANPDQAGSVADKIRTSKVLRTVGQAVFLADTIIMGTYAVFLLTRRKVRSPIVHLVLIGFPFLVVRGIYGILAPYVAIFNYFDFKNYGEHGLQAGFVAAEYLMATSMEFVVACLLMSTLFYYREDNTDKIAFENTKVLNQESQDSKHLSAESATETNQV